jgi:hypothetical protein
VISDVEDLKHVESRQHIVKRPNEIKELIRNLPSMPEESVYTIKGRKLVFHSSSSMGEAPPIIILNRAIFQKPIEPD